MGSAPLTPWPWVGRALIDATILLALGYVAGGLGAFTVPWVGMAVGSVFVCLGGAAWSVSRIGGAGLGAALLGLMAAIGTSIEGHHARVARTAEIVELPGLSSWKPEDGDIALHVGPLEVRTDLEAWVSYRAGSGKHATTNTEIVTPVYDPAEGRVVGFHCRSRLDERRSDGAWVLSSPAWLGATDMKCSPGVNAARENLRAAGLVEAPDAEARLVEVFASERDLRNAADLDAVVKAPGLLFVLYLVLVVVFRQRGADSANVGR